MEDEHIFVQDVLKKHNISVSQLADQVGIADSTLYEYTGGRKKNIPISVWRALYELTEDVKIVNMITGRVESFVVPLPRPESPDCTEDTLKRLIEKRKKDIECETAILDILADGKIDSNDFKAIEQYRDAHPESIRLSTQIYYSVMKRYEESLKKEKK